MQVTETKNAGLQREYKIVVDAKAINERIDAQLKSMGARVKVPGFRPGHIPLTVLRQRYGKSVLSEALENTVNQSSQKVIKDKGLKPAMPAKIQIEDYKEGGDLSFKVELEVLPAIPAIDYNKIQLDRMVYEADDAEVEEALSRLAEGSKQHEALPESTKAKKGNIVNIDFVGKIDGTAFAGGTAKNVKLELGSNTFIPGFEDQLIGAKAGDEKLVKVSFPADYHKEDLQNKPAEFEVKVNSVMEAKAPELNDGFAKLVGFDSLDKLKQGIRERLNEEYKGIARTRLKKALFDYLEANCTFQAPESMLKAEFEGIWQKLQAAKSEGDPSLQKPDNELKEEYSKIAERRVRLGLILSDIGSSNKLQITRDELAKAVQAQAAMFPGQERQVFDFYQKNPRQLDDLRGPILEDKAVDFILEKAKIADRKVSKEELTAEDDEEGDNSASGGKAKKAAKAKSEEKETKAKKKAAS